MASLWRCRSEAPGIRIRPNPSATLSIVRDTTRSSYISPFQDGNARTYVKPVAYTHNILYWVNQGVTRMMIFSRFYQSCRWITSLKGKVAGMLLRTGETRLAAATNRK